MEEGIKDINQKIAYFKRKYYLNLVIRGAILAPSLALGYFLIATLLEYNLWLGRSSRFLIFFLFVALVAFCVYYFFRKPIQWLLYKKGLGEEESARIIGDHFPSVSDRLLNIIQLASSSKKNSLVEAGIAQKSGQLQNVQFEKAVDISLNKKYLRYLLVPIGAILILTFVDSTIFTNSTGRIVRFNQEFSPQAPFQFSVTNSNLVAFFNEDFILQVSMKGSAIPESAYLISGSQRWKMEGLGNGDFQYAFEKLQNTVSFQIEASGFYSSPYKIELANRPEVNQIKISLAFPAYTGKRSEEITNVGNIEVPEGTLATWRIKAAHANEAQISFSVSGESFPMKELDNELFGFGKKFNNDEQYSILLKNESSQSKDKISYSVNVVKDQYPQLLVENLRDSILYKSILLGGQAKDDYGITELQLIYQLNDDSKKLSIKIPLANGSAQQNFFHSWNVDSLHLKPSDKLTYYFEVWDNDGVNGRKSTRSATYMFSLPSEAELKTAIADQQKVAENKIDKSIQKASDLRESLDEVQQKLKGKQSLDWQDKKLLEDLVNQKQKLDKSVNDLQKENQLLEQKKETFTQENERIKEKSDQIQKLMNELLDDETKKLFQELEKLLKENSDISQIQRLLEKMDRKELNLEKELERTLELFKQLQYDYKLDQAINDLKAQAEKQEKLIKDTEVSSEEKPKNGAKDDKEGKDGEEKNKKDNKNKSSDQKDEKKEKDGKEGDNSKGDDKKDQSDQKNNQTGDQDNSKSDENGKKQQGEKKSNEELAKDQQELQKELENLEKTVEDLKKLGEEADKEDNSPTKEDFDQLQQSEQQSQEQLNQGKPKNSLAPQKKSLNQMKQMQKQMQGMQNSMEMEMDMQNLESLRQIVHGLIKLSYDQESLMKEFNSVQQSDPKYLQISQGQLKLQNDAKVLEDSLLALGKKDPFMGSVVTREIGELNDHLDKSVAAIKDRRKGNAGAEMQFSMANINNLALMLNDHFDMMMNAAASSKSGSGKKSKGQKSSPSLSKMQQQINDQIEKLKGQQKSGRQYSEDLARVAAEQERIRRALQEMQEKMKNENGAQIGNDIPAKMEQTEMDLVNKQITEQTIRRQNEIMTRLLEAEKSMREQDMDKERKGETAKDYQKEMPRAFEDYLRLKEKEVELLKTLPPKLFPYYKKEVNEYFKRIN
ncbi:hypothetical protein WSM22_15170 [Cytophagales bacterium WSM2-2]|nr:hypothetical protein WSM22_15170 [Cytophagales bacterium WSM2-2]